MTPSPLPRPELRCRGSSPPSPEPLSMPLNPHARIALARELIDLARSRIPMELTEAEAIEEILTCFRWLGNDSGLLIHPIIGNSNRRFWQESGQPKRGRGPRVQGLGPDTENSQES